MYLDLDVLRENFIIYCCFSGFIANIAGLIWIAF